jgi:hypothetical protein
MESSHTIKPTFTTLQPPSSPQNHRTVPCPPRRYSCTRTILNKSNDGKRCGKMFFVHQGCMKKSLLLTQLEQGHLSETWRRPRYKSTAFPFSAKYLSTSYQYLTSIVSKKWINHQTVLQWRVTRSSWKEQPPRRTSP